MRCNFQVGFFIVRECGREGACACVQCGRRVCAGHRSITEDKVVCLRCRPTIVDDQSRSHGEHDRSSSSSTDSFSSTNYSSPAPTFEGGGGRFGGAGASGSWSDAGSSTSNLTQPNSPALLGGLPMGSPDSSLTQLEAAGFSESDAELFDKVAGFDETQDDRTSYDS